jgi:hypothetical protein
LVEDLLQNVVHAAINILLRDPGVAAPAGRQAAEQRLQQPALAACQRAIGAGGVARCRANRTKDIGKVRR